MTWTTGRLGRAVRGVLAAALLAAGAWTCGALVRSSSEARGEVRQRTSREHFQPAAALSQPTLKEIAATLRRIDGRLERIEKAAREALAAQRTRSATAGERGPE